MYLVRIVRIIVRIIILLAKLKDLLGESLKDFESLGNAERSSLCLDVKFGRKALKLLVIMKEYLYSVSVSGLQVVSL